jgi:Uma2 family endonuclease
MAHEIIAPWAERVPGASPMTADELLALHDDGWQYELVDGVLVRMPSPGYRHGRIVFRLAMALATYVTAHRLGEIVAAETGFLLSRPGEPDTVLGPDIAFVRSEHVPPHDAPGVEKYLRLAPDLVVEVASPDQYKPEMAAKARLYLAAGVRLVWLVWPAAHTVDVWRPGNDAPITSLTTAEALDGLDVVPGFTYPLADLF